jgi:hypothetical protein
VAGPIRTVIDCVREAPNKICLVGGTGKKTKKMFCITKLAFKEDTNELACKKN